MPVLLSSALAYLVKLPDPKTRPGWHLSNRRRRSQPPPLPLARPRPHAPPPRLPWAARGPGQPLPRSPPIPSRTTALRRHRGRSRRSCPAAGPPPRCWSTTPGMASCRGLRGATPVVPLAQTSPLTKPPAKAPAARGLREGRPPECHSPPLQVRVPALFPRTAFDPHVMNLVGCTSAETEIE